MAGLWGFFFESVYIFPFCLNPTMDLSYHVGYSQSDYWLDINLGVLANIEISTCV